jgi:hypothetical protein
MRSSCIDALQAGAGRAKKIRASLFTNFPISALECNLRKEWNEEKKFISENFVLRSECAAPQ